MRWLVITEIVLLSIENRADRFLKAKLLSSLHATHLCTSTEYSSIQISERLAKRT